METGSQPGFWENLELAEVCGDCSGVPVGWGRRREGSFKCGANMSANQTGNGASDTEGGSHEGPCYDFREQIRQKAAAIV